MGALVIALALVLSGGLIASVNPAPANAANNYNLLIADNLGKRLLITDPWGKIKWVFNNPLNNSNTYSGPLGAKWEPGNKILATFGTGVVGLIDAATKTFDWKFNGCQATNWLQSPYDAEILPDGNLAIATRYNENGRVAVYNRQGCTIVWKYLLSNAHSVRMYNPGYNTNQITLLMGGWGQTAEAIYQSGVSTYSPTVVWSVPTEYTHDAMVIPNGDVVTVEGYYIQQITRADSQVWKVSTPNEDRRVAVNPDGGYIFSVANADQIEFRDANGNLIRTFSYVSDGTKLNLPYAVQVICWPDLCGSPSPTPTPTATPTPTPTATPTPTPTPTPTATATATPTPTPTSTATSGTLFSDGFESGNFNAWSTVRTGADGSATVQSSAVKTGTYAARLSETSTSGSYAYARKTLSAGQTQITVSGDFRIDQEGASGANVPLIRLYDGSGTRILQLYRQNQSYDRIWLNYAGSYYSTTGTLSLGSWAHFDLSVVINGTSSTVSVQENGTQIYSTTTASLGANPVLSFQVGNDTASQTFTSYADNITATTP